LARCRHKLLGRGFQLESRIEPAENVAIIEEAQQ
jgi:hypothetical protein